MKWSVQQLQALRHKGLQVDESVDMSQIMQVDREIRGVTPVLVRGKALFSKESVTFLLQISGSMTLPCARTLNDVEHPFTIQATEIFPLDEWATFEEDDEDVHDLDGQTVNLLPYIQERILLEKPLRVFSDKKAGPAPEEGPGWQLNLNVEEDEESDDTQVDPRLKKLEQFFDKK
ncbi:YceD family protein [Salisediminibacterium selenitireducens]|uniref:DUF177 domain-containing protein n=1 Tax=Bacillus selenitireducens (strain ATCC 700615 / DSM 15326 / MLS10) TaxID=439292 RepID=D6XTL1_BACIE|nr:YceD family protein [Salisediminibacterium selenitireducens]ADH99147.1 protein of unknown function DUF177 [[Bacillus] selenitireducens MLS10]